MSDKIKPAFYDYIVIGTGQGGLPLAKKLADNGHSVAIIEKNKVGGSCINFGCTPTKTMIASADVAHSVSVADQYGISLSLKHIDLEKIQKRKNEVVAMFRKGSESGIEATDNLTLIHGEASFKDHHTLTVNGESISFSHCIINTGNSPNIPTIEGVEQLTYHTSNNIMDVEAVPEHLIIIGGSYIGLEFGQLFQRLGSKVSIVERSPRLVKNEDEDIADALFESLKKSGMKFYFNAKVVKLEGRESDSIIAKFDVDGKTQMLTGTHLLFATGRKPNTNRLKVENAKIALDDKGYIEVNEQLTTSQPHIYAIGDVKGGPAFTHVSFDDYRQLENLLIHNRPIDISDRQIPYTMFTDPQLARVGLNELQANAQNVVYKVASLPMARVARAIHIGKTDGLLKVLISKADDTILGASLLGHEAGELLATIQVAMIGKLPYTKLLHGIFSHPTLAESLNNLMMTIKDPE